MKYKLENAPLSRIDCDLLVVGIFSDETVKAVLSGLDADFHDGDLEEFLSEITKIAADDSFQGKINQTLVLPTYSMVGTKRLVLVGLGRRADFKPQLSRKIGAQMARRFASNQSVHSVCFHCRFDTGFAQAKDSKRSEGKRSSKRATARSTAARTDARALYEAWKKETPSGEASRHICALLEGWKLGAYSFVKYKSSKDDKRTMMDIEFRFSGWHDAKAASLKPLQTAEAIAEATNYARCLIAEPPIVMTPSRLAQEAKKVASDTGITCKIMDAAQVEKLGMGAFLGVARGAREPLRFIVMRYKAPKSKKEIAIVGKGITFDSGGLSLKPAQSMEHMKYDMSGAAAVIATMRVVGLLKPEVSVLGVVAATENMPGSNAMHPGDVITAMNGKTIEVNNTDAEGRLVLADALTYAQRQGVDEMIDIATLTGAIVTALGRTAAGVMGSDQALIDRLVKAASEAGEKLWQMPMFDEYKEYLKSDVADLKNAGSRGEAGSSAGGMFLKEFVDSKPWAHLDIAGPGWLDRDRDECNKGGTAFGVRTLCYYILSQ